MRSSVNQMWRYHFEGTAAGPSLSDRVERMLLHAIESKVLIEGVALPSSRELADQLGVARNTVLQALERLIDAGYVCTRQRQGYYVSALAERSPPEGEYTDSRAAAGPTASPEPDWSAHIPFRPSTQRNISKPRERSEVPYAFAYGQIDAALFRQSQWRECNERVLRSERSRGLLDDHCDQDDPMLLEQIRARLLPRRGVWARESEILVTVGAQHALYLLMQLLARPGLVVGVEDPGYPDIRNMIELHRASARPLPVDAHGLVVGPGIASCNALYVTPGHQCPTTVTMSIDRRHELLQAAARHDVIVIEDDYEPEASYDGPPSPTLKSMDAASHVVYVGSLSKTMVPGVRLGYIVADEALIVELRALRRLMLRHPPATTQRALALFLAEGHFDTLARRMQAAYKARASELAGHLAAELPSWRSTSPTGGSSQWIELPENVDSGELAAELLAHGVYVEPGSVFYADPASGRNRLRLGFSSIPIERIGPGIQRIRRVLDSHRTAEGKSPGPVLVP